jgi:hypothetical protein
LGRVASCDGINSNPSFKLVYRRENYNGLGGFADSDWGNSESRRSTTGLLARYNKYIVLWRSKIQNAIALSIAEAEYYSASEIAAVYEDNTACIN